MYLASNIRYLRRSRSLSQNELAARLGYKSFTTVQKWESGVAVPSYRKLQQIAETFNVSVSDLTGRDLASHDMSVSYVPEKKYFEMTVIDDNMEPDYHQSDVVLIEWTTDFADGNDCVVRLEDGSVIFRRIRREGDQLIFYTLAPGVAPITLDISDSGKTFRILGIAKQIKRNI